MKAEHSFKLFLIRSSYELLLPANYVKMLCILLKNLIFSVVSKWPIMGSVLLISFYSYFYLDFIKHTLIRFWGVE